MSVLVPLMMPSTPSKSTEAALQDILDHIDLAIGFVANLDNDLFKKDIKTVYAVVRCLEIISEASRRLPNELKVRHTAIGWREMAAAGNRYRHDYEDVAAGRVWETLQQALPPLKQVIELEIGRFSGPKRDL